MFEAAHSDTVRDSAGHVWERWVDPSRWAEWDPRVERAEAEGDLAEGTAVRVKLRKGGTTHHRVVALEPGRRLVTEYGLPGARVGHERVVEPAADGSEVTHRLYVDGPVSGFWALMLGRRRMREQVAALTDA